MTSILNEYKIDNDNRLSKGSMRYYMTVIHHLLDITNKPINVITRKDIRKWMQTLAENGNGPNTLRAKLYALRSFFRYCMEEKVIEEDPTKGIMMLLIPDRVPYYLEWEQLTRLREHTKSHPRNRAIVEVLYATGVRVSELVRIKLWDIDFSERTIHIRKGKGKRDRIVPFTRECQQRILDYLAVKEWDTTWLFVNRFGDVMQTRGVQYWFEKWTKELNIPMSVHVMRHTFAAHLAQKGMPLAGIQTLLGHESVQDTLVYAKLYDHVRKQMYDDYH